MKPPSPQIATTGRSGCTSLAAIAEGIDREFLADVIDQGTTFATTTGIHQGSPFFNPDTEHYGGGIEAAQTRLSDAGIDPAQGTLEQRILLSHVPEVRRNFFQRGDIQASVPVRALQHGHNRFGG